MNNFETHLKTQSFKTEPKIEFKKELKESDKDLRSPGDSSKESGIELTDKSSVEQYATEKDKIEINESFPIIFEPTRTLTPESPDKPKCQEIISEHSEATQESDEDTSEESIIFESSRTKENSKILNSKSMMKPLCTPIIEKKDLKRKRLKLDQSYEHSIWSIPTSGNGTGIMCQSNLW